MKNLAALSVLAATLFTGGVVASAETTETMDDIVNVTAVEGVGYKFEVSHKACSKDKHIVTSATTSTMIASDTDTVSQKTADALAALYNETVGKSMGQPFDAFVASYNAAEINRWKKEADRGKQPQLEPTKGFVAFVKSIRTDAQAFYDGMISILDNGAGKLDLKMGGVAADAPSPLCK